LNKSNPQKDNSNHPKVKETNSGLCQNDVILPSCQTEHWKDWITRVCCLRHSSKEKWTSMMVEFVQLKVLPTNFVMLRQTTNNNIDASPPNSACERREKLGNGQCGCLLL